MSTSLVNRCSAPVAAVLWIAATPWSGNGSEPKLFDVPVANPGFSEGVDGKGVPLGWSRYGGASPDRELQVTEGPGGRKALRIVDRDPLAETGVCQSFAAKGGETYRVTVQACALEDATPGGAYLQFRFLPSQQLVQAGLSAESTKAFSEVAVEATAPPDTTQGLIYLYTHREPTPQVLVTGVRVQGGLPPPPPPPPAPVPPQYTRLKELHRSIALVERGKPNAVIVAPADDAGQSAARMVQQAITHRTGVPVPIVREDAPEAAVPLRGNVIALGNRSNNQMLSKLYDRFYCLADLKYPGPEGYVLRTVHNPFGKGASVVLVGASDAPGLAAGAGKFCSLAAQGNGGKGELALGWTMETQLGRGVKVPTDIKEFETWEASRGYGSVGYFGWCSISKRMAMYAMTGDAFSAREVVRLSFPDQQALRDIEEIDGERIENKHDPLAGFYHYNAHLAILFWDLIEESPVFSDEERLKITNAFARQLNHRKDEGIYGLTRPSSRGVGSRHGQWSAISLYCLGRYFNKSYPNPVWAQCERAGALAFQSLHRHAWVAGESDNLFWYSTGFAPILTYLVLTGDRKPLENGVLAELLRGQEILISGRTPDWALHSAALDMLNKAAYLTGDGRWVTYRERTGVDTEVFRLGQSFWPGPELKAARPEDLAGKWSVHRLPKPAWEARGSGLPYERSFYFASYRSAADAGGDYVLLDGFNGASRNPYHTWDILELRLASRTVLQGYHNQVLTSADGMVEPAVPMDAALVHCDVLGETALAVGEVPGAAFCNWRRSLCQRTGRYALIVDDLSFRTDSQNMTVATTWEMPGGRWDPKEQAIRLPASGPAPAVELRPASIQEVRPGGAVSLTWSGAVKRGERRRAFYLIAPAGGKDPDRLACLGLGDGAAVLALPQPALAVAGGYQEIQGELVVLDETHLFGHALTRARLGADLLTSDKPVDLDWDLATGAATVVSPGPVTLLVGGRGISLPGGRSAVTLPALPAAERGRVGSALRELLAEGHRQRAAAKLTPPLAEAGLPELPVAFTANVGGKVAASVVMPGAGDPQLAVAAGSTIWLFSAAGQEVRKLQTDAPVRVLRWWEECQLLLAGCVDEKVIAFDREGRRSWVFVSEMDPAVYEAAKTYWFKSAPGHEGIHGLHTGVFDGGKSRCFVGSACTLEILDTAGKLVKRTPVFWGPCWKFLLTRDGDGSPKLLIAQWPNGGDSLAIVPSRTMVDAGHGFFGVPAGHSYVGGWTAQNRAALLQCDLNADGQPEIATAVNGTWNRVTVYSTEGKPLVNVQFGPGSGSAPGSRMRDMAVLDLDGDGKQEMVAGLAEGLVVALSHAGEKRWARKLPSAPARLRGVQPLGEPNSWILVGCDDGRVEVLGHDGTPVLAGRVKGRPLGSELMETSTGPVVVWVTSEGELKGFQIGTARARAHPSVHNAQ